MHKQHNKVFAVLETHVFMLKTSTLSIIYFIV